MASKKTTGKGLGKGINALFEENGLADSLNDVTAEQVEDVALSDIRPNPYQPRRTFDRKALKELASSIEKSGVFQPIIVRQPDEKLNRYEIIAGERRFRASKLAGKSSIPAIVRTMNEQEMMEVAVLENLQREDLTPLEEAEAYQTLMSKLNLTQAEVSARLGKSRPYIANYIRLLGLPDVIKKMLADNELSMGQARTLLGLKDKRKVVALARRVVKNGMTVRELEKVVGEMNGDKQEVAKTPVKKSAYVRASEDQLQEKFGTKVQISNANNEGQGHIEIDYMSNDDLSRILDILGISLD
ncbi:ParB/RepB/Spo0J family partition protein [Furfurilactobacillus rossiae]|uniref:Chromosome partitioning protein, DNA-binding protein n=1 Tax=Furfurilactobacillus rossiae DSM 15814 TaxID=1114972 RepID=A0A0R1RFF4_9LACO|nr:ParB/RepB/Spo0J family partition protein [Furfurilactobacillus rossiae]KRL52978.1 chromosome partitioning protein, DNA-binding protein [Furfurilactobacillus rossiae DSM 15814]QFR67570.1 ParB/RepB/Spo0J family partition protein [Furfurilactobacillus rossiae]QLE60523.1 Chromosome plasmid partitioning protein ParB - Stage 0 sporulation protein J [Furfurilactobacillus rossiae]